MHPSAFESILSQNNDEPGDMPVQNEFQNMPNGENGGFTPAPDTTPFPAEAPEQPARQDAEMAEEDVDVFEMITFVPEGEEEPTKTPTPRRAPKTPAQHPKKRARAKKPARARAGRTKSAQKSARGRRSRSARTKRSASHGMNGGPRRSTRRNVSSPRKRRRR